MGVLMVADEISRYKLPTAEELEALFGDITTLCDTCRWHGVWRERTVTSGGFKRMREHDFCCIGVAKGETDELEKLTSVVSECGGWEMAE